MWVLKRMGQKMVKSRYNQRMHSRYHLVSPIRFAKRDSERLLSARMLNISNGGMCFETRYALDPSSDVCIWMEKDLHISHKGIQIYDFYRSKVLWCREIDGEDALGVGVLHVNKSRWASGPEFICSGCEEKIPVDKVHFCKDFIYLCPNCFQIIQGCSENDQKKILRLLEGNVF